jgi:hypothetical protein
MFVSLSELAVFISDNEKGYENSMQGRGSANKARYSADIEHLMRNLKV